ncbi:MAG TPA: DHA2 family efflux MFS transporter permease subunit [Pelagibacterium sp.]|uniref:DHA2 family efflux MFS transporter permease subunit n=1 Tax=Pelagibacterium sp. TaxID=1967288 RepID=UPI002C57D539|nr:DHA2 family efflux MFS transporter permease subunit [Pelagibacterium sp.]HWJ88104.1 DHA2 family efflux MFS transporter permease subunit [Pelagibacterium sp.]
MSPTEIPGASAPDDSLIDRETASRNRLVIALLLVSAFVVILNETIMSVAIPHLMGDLGITASAAQWLTSAFMLTMAVVIPITGYLLQRLNTRPVFVLAMSLFSAGTAVSAIAPGFEALLLGRVVQATGTAIMMPLLMTTVMNLVPPHARGRTMGNISIVISVAPAIGPTIGGFILEHFDWRWMFILVLPIALASLALGYAKIQNVSAPTKAPFDVLSVILSALGFGGLVYGLSSLGQGGGAGTVFPSWLPLVVGVVGLGVFIARQFSLQKRDAALLDLRTFATPIFTISVVMMAISMMAMFGSLILLPIYMQNVLGLEISQVGLMLLPGGLLMGLIAPLVGRLFDKYGPTVLLVPGSALVSIVLWTMTTLNPNTPVMFLLGLHVTLSLGLALMFTPLFTSSLGSLPRHLYPHGSAVIGTVQQVAGAAGIALFVSLMSMRTADLMAHGVPELSATSQGIQLAFLCGAITSLFAIVAAFFIRRPPERPMDAEAVPGH